MTKKALLKEKKEVFDVFRARAGFPSITTPGQDRHSGH
jgi:hypothetical protein